jgi:hypothetical protein
VARDLNGHLLREVLHRRRVPPRCHVIAGMDVLVCGKNPLVDCLVASSSGGASSWEGTVFALGTFVERDLVTYS